MSNPKEVKIGDSFRLIEWKDESGEEWLLLQGVVDGEYVTLSAQPGDQSRGLVPFAAGAVVAFRATQSAGSLTGDAQVTFDTEAFDTASAFASSSFTAPVAGIYRFNAAIRFTSFANAQATSDSANLDISVDSVDQTPDLVFFPTNTNSGFYNGSIARSIQLTAGQVVKFRVAFTTNPGVTAYNAIFEGSLLMVGHVATDYSCDLTTDERQQLAAPGRVR